MKDIMYLGSSPADEPCVQAGTSGYYERSREECERYIKLIRKCLGPEPENAKLAIKNNPHDLGDYLEVVCYFENTDERACEYAIRCDNRGPLEWSDGDEFTVEIMGSNVKEHILRPRLSSVFHRVSKGLDDGQWVKVTMLSKF